MKRLAKWVVFLSALLTVVWLTAAAADQPATSNGHGHGQAHPDSGTTGSGNAQGNNGNPQGNNGNGNVQGNGNSQGTSGKGNANGTPSGTTGPQSGDNPAQPPRYGATVDVDHSSGTVTVTLPGQAKAVPISDASSLPVGTVIDTTHGHVTLVTAVGDSGETQSATFSGGAFSLRQPNEAGGYTEIRLHGPRPAGCPKARAAAGATMARRHRHHRRPTHLWVRDHHGHFRTHGQNSVATVRGTRWLTVERCDGTLTHVASGKVAVRDLHRHRTVLVKAHHTYLARG